VEDNPDSMTTLWAILNGQFTLIEARDGEEGLKAAVERSPDLILLDMSLPGMDGTAVLARLRENAATREIPVVALTAHAMKGDRERLLAAGCDDYLSKPIEVSLLLEVVDRWLRPGSGPGG
jgi:CheY-like chemotaxis protein